MLKIFFKKFALSLIILQFFVATSVIQAATLELETEDNTLNKIGETSLIDVILKSEKSNINAISGRIAVSNVAQPKVELRYQGSSNIDYWLIPPQIAAVDYQNKLPPYIEISFSGLILESKNQNLDQYQLFQILVTPQKKQEVDLYIYEALAYTADGAATPIELELVDETISFEDDSEAEKDQTDESETKDDPPPTPAKQAAYTYVPKPDEPVSQAAPWPTYVPKPDEPVAGSATAESQKRLQQYKKEQETVQNQKIIEKSLYDSTTRCEFIVMNGRASTWSIDSKITKSRYFKDAVSNDLSWCAPYLDYAYEKGFIKGRKDRTFSPNELITRYEVALIVARQLTSEKDLNNQTKTDFTDDSNIPSWARGAVAYLNQRRIFTGHDNGNGTFSFRGDLFIVKVNAAIVLYRTFQK